MWWRKLNFKNILKSILKALFFIFKLCLILIGIIIALIILLILLMILIMTIDYNISNEPQKCTSFYICKEGLMIETYSGIKQVSEENCKGEEVVKWDNKRKSCIYEDYVIKRSWKAD